MAIDSETRPIPDQVLIQVQGSNFLDRPFVLVRKQRWDNEDVQPKPKTHEELEKEMTGPHDLG